MMTTSTMPIESVIPELLQALRENAGAVLIAEPGAGKTTRVPLFLMREPWLENRRIVMLEPRRLAARSAARHMAYLLQEEVGETIGYRVRGESRSGPHTRIEVVTEGVLTRMLQSDPSLEGVGIVIFDEFHERSLHADLGLALCLESQEIFRSDLRLLVMSATLEAEPVARLLGGAPVIHSVGRSFPVTTRYLDRRGEGSIEPVVDRAVRRALAETDGDVLVFLPGTREIRIVSERLADLKAQGVQVAPLHGGLSHEAQDRALAPGSPGLRKVVLATSVAETSLTVEGVKVVIDSGLARVSRFSPRTGMRRLETTRVSKASADQRRGRAGRLGPGVCYRLWTEHDHARLAPRPTPEILEADLAPIALELALWGALDPWKLRWLDPPPEAGMSQAIDLLQQLGAISERGGITEQGRRMAELGIHPRLARMVLAALPLGYGRTACLLAALLEERDIFRGDRSAPDPDVRLRLEAAQSGRRFAGGGLQPEVSVDWDSVRRIQAEARRLTARLGIESGEYKRDLTDACGLLLAFAFPDRIAERKPSGRYLMRNGRGAVFSGVHPLAEEPHIVAVELDDKGADSRILLAAPVQLDELEEHFETEIQIEELVEWDRAARSVVARRRVRLGALTLRDEPLRNPDAGRTLQALLAGIKSEGLLLLPWTKASRSLQQRLLFMRRTNPDWPDVSDASLLAGVEEWLAPYLTTVGGASDLQKLDLVAIIEGMLTWEQRRELDICAPTHFQAPSGSRVPIDYSDPEAPSISVRLQEMFGLRETPRIARGRTPLRLNLLSPAFRPVQVTQDLESFWQAAYFEVRKELKARYPKHHWPDDPLTATPKAL